jgi:putative transcriptional regulator
MTIRHHPSEETLMRFASGAIEQPFHIALAAHLEACVLCRKEAALWEGVGGVMLEDMAPAEMTDGALARALAAVDGKSNGAARNPARAASNGRSSLPASLRRYRVGPEFPIGPGIYKRSIWKAKRGTARVYLLRGRPGLELPRHGHSGVEMTYVVQGGYSDEHGHYGPGDLFTADASHSHQPRVDDDGECVLLIASDGRAVAGGWFGVLVRMLL